MDRNNAPANSILYWTMSRQKQLFCIISYCGLQLHVCWWCIIVFFTVDSQEVRSQLTIAHVILFTTTFHALNIVKRNQNFKWNCCFCLNVSYRQLRDGSSMTALGLWLMVLIYLANQYNSNAFILYGIFICEKENQSMSSFETLGTQHNAFDIPTRRMTQYFRFILVISLMKAFWKHTSHRWCITDTWSTLCANHSTIND